MGKIFWLYIFFSLITGSFGCTTRVSAQKVSDSLKDSIVHVLKDNLKTASQWTKVHAAEYLIDLGYREGIKETFLKEQKKYGTEAPYQIGIWRVLVQAGQSPEEKQPWIRRILKVYGDTSAIDRVHAAETLAKLHISPAKRYPDLTHSLLNSPDDLLSVYTHWAVVSSLRADSIQNKKNYFLSIIFNESKAPEVRSVAAYALRHLGRLGADDWYKLAKTALEKSKDSKAEIYITSAAFVTAPKDYSMSETYSEIHKKLLSFKSSSKADEVKEMTAALVEQGSVKDLPVLIELYKNGKNGNSEMMETLSDPDVEDGIGYAILKIGIPKS